MAKRFIKIFLAGAFLTAAGAMFWWVLAVPGVLLLLLGLISFILFSFQNKNLLREKSRVQEIIRESDKKTGLISATGKNREVGNCSFTVLLENHVKKEQAGDSREGSHNRISNQHGLSIYLEKLGLNFLMDTGPDATAFNNARALGIDITRIQGVFISHGHFDHGGGLDYFLKNNRQAPVYLSEKAIKEEYYAKVAGVIKRELSLDHYLLDEHPDRFVFIKEFTEIAPGVWVIPAMDQHHPLPSGNRMLYRKTTRGLEQDDFDHEQALVIKQEEGLVVYSGCCHNGVLNVMDTVKKHFPGEKVKAILGGFHLYNPVLLKMEEKKEEVSSLGKRLNEKEFEKCFTGHCTGGEAYSILEEELGDRLVYFYTGASFKL